MSPTQTSIGHESRAPSHTLSGIWVQNGGCWVSGKGRPLFSQGAHHQGRRPQCGLIPSEPPGGFLCHQSPCHLPRLEGHLTTTVRHVKGTVHLKTGLV